MVSEQSGSRLSRIYCVDAMSCFLRQKVWLVTVYLEKSL